MGSPDIRSATLRFASANAQQKIVSSQQTPDINATVSVTRIQQSENSPSTRALKETLPDPDEFIKLMAVPSNWYQGGLDFSWEIDLWGHVRCAEKASDADVVNNYYNLRGILQQIMLTKQDEKVLDERLSLIQARTSGGALDDISQERQRSELAGTRASLTDLQAQEGVAMNQLLLLLGMRPGALQKQLQASEKSLMSDNLLALQLGIPSEVALNRPDIRAAEAKLHSATARMLRLNKNFTNNRYAQPLPDKLCH